MARELMVVLEYKAWRYFNDVINKSKLSCELSGNIINEYFVVNNKTMVMSSGVNDKNIIDLVCYGVC